MRLNLKNATTTELIKLQREAKRAVQEGGDLKTTCAGETVTAPSGAVVEGVVTQLDVMLNRRSALQIEIDQQEKIKKDADEMLLLLLAEMEEAHNFEC